jgi:hypothetical protein
VFGEIFAIVVCYVVDLSLVEHVTTNIKILFGVIAPRMTNMLMGIEHITQQFDYFNIV